MAQSKAQSYPCSSSLTIATSRYYSPLFGLIITTNGDIKLDTYYLLGVYMVLFNEVQQV